MLSLTRERVCRLQLLLILASAIIIRSKSRGIRDHILLSQIRDSPNLEGQVPVFISPKNWVAQLYPQALGSLFIASYDSQGHDRGIRPRLHTGMSHSLSQPVFDPRYMVSGQIQQKTPFPNNSFIVIEICLSHCCIETAVLILLRACLFPQESVYRGVAWQ
jgi:hypothetical protein